MVFHALNKNIDGFVSPVHISNIPIEKVFNFNFMEVVYWHNNQHNSEILGGIK